MDHRPKTARLAKDAILLLYEIWSQKTFLRIEFMMVDDNGNVIQEPTVLDGDHQLRVAPTDALVVIDGKFMKPSTPPPPLHVLRKLSVARRL